jgi:DNA mismatch endonuclease (patch repair protein)
MGTTANRARNPDPLTPEQRRRNMSAIRGRNTKPELVIRRALHARGLRYRLHAKDLPGTPDIIFPGRKAVIFVHGCFWHGHDCRLFKLPSSNPEFWERKIQANQRRDARVQDALARLGWRGLLVWECSIRGPDRSPTDAVIERIVSWLDAPESEFCEIGELGADHK